MRRLCRADRIEVQATEYLLATARFDCAPLGAFVAPLSEGVNFGEQHVDV